MYGCYINSKQYYHEYKRIYKKEGEEFTMLVHFIAKVFVDYHMQGKGNKPNEWNMMWKY